MPTLSEHPSTGLDPITILQNRWYNCLTTHLHLDRAMFQLRQLSNPMIQSNQDLWALQNILPPVSLTFNSSSCLTELFFDEYSAIISQLEHSEINFRKLIGDEFYKKWQTHLKTITPPPPDNKLPILFREWALMFAPSVMSVGTSALLRMVLINRVLKSLQDYQGSNARIVDFNGDYANIVNVLKNSTGANFVFDSNLANDNVENTWAGGNENRLAGLWSHSCSNSRLSRRFAQSHININVELKSYTVYTSVPGSWYDSSLLNTAYSNKNASPWPINPNPTWEDVFGEAGSMRQIIISLVVADGINTTVSSDASFCKTDQQTIQRSAMTGLWPFYIPENGNSTANVVVFDEVKGMRIETITQSGSPFIIGNNVLPIAYYLGHAVKQ